MDGWSVRPIENSSGQELQPAQHQIQAESKMVFDSGSDVYDLLTACVRLQ